MNFRLEYLLLGLVLCLTLAMAQNPAPTSPPVPKIWGENSKNIYPSPQSNYLGCNRPDKSWICDPNKVYNEVLVNQVDELLNKLRGSDGGCPCSNTTSCSYKGLPIIVAIMEDFDSNGTSSSVDSLMKSYATHFLNSWKFYDCDDGIAIVIGANVSIGAKVVRNYAVRSKELVDTKCQGYIDKKSKSLYEGGDVISGLEMDLKTYSAIMAKSTECKDSELFFISVIIIVILVAVIVAIIIAIVLIRKRQKSKEISGAGKDRAGQPLNAEKRETYA